MVFLLYDFALTAGTSAAVNATIKVLPETTYFLYSCLYGCLTAPPPPVESTTAKDQNQNNDDKYGFHAHDLTPFPFEGSLLTV